MRTSPDAVHNHVRKRPSTHQGSKTPGGAGYDGSVSNFFRHKLPPTWRYGARWKAVKLVWYGAAASGAYAIYLTMFPGGEAQRLRASDYVVAFDERGRPCDLGYRPLVEAAERARERSRRIGEGDI